jgi:hypothetical protein
MRRRKLLVVLAGLGLARDYAARDAHAEETLVTEAEWLAATDPLPMLEYLRDKASDRKLRLFAAACCRFLYRLIPDQRSRKAIGVAERFADGEVSPDKLRYAWGSARRSASTRRRLQRGESATAQDFALWAVTLALDEDPRRYLQPGGNALTSARQIGLLLHSELDQSSLIRDILGNPFRAAPAVTPVWLAWQDGTVPQLACAVYEDRLPPNLTLDPAHLAAMADALEDAGCADAELLGHLRSPGPHVRGCWAVDLVLERS